MARRHGAMSEWLMVAEKPAIARAIADALAPNGHTKERSQEPNCNIPVFTFQTNALGALGPARVRVTSTVGHIYGLDFGGRYRKWGCDPSELFDAPTEKIFAGDAPVKEHLEKEASWCNMLMLWLDCDREGENICFEVMDAVLPCLRPDYSDEDRIWRSRFSSLAPADLWKALSSLVKPNIAQSKSVDARQIIDLKVGVALTRLLTGALRESARGLAPDSGTKGPLISYGPCQGPALGFVVSRYDEIQRFNVEKSSTLDIHVMDAVLHWRPKADGLHVHSERYLLEQWAQNCKEVRFMGGNRPKECWIQRPVALNTVAMLKAASTELGFDPAYGLECAEKLYLQGNLTYPRTESTHYPESQDLRSLVGQFVNEEEVGWWARELQHRYTEPQWGHDAGDHPPIMPVKYARIDGDLGKLYRMVVRHFLASVSPDLVYRKHEARFESHGEHFTLGGSELVDKGWSNIIQCKQRFMNPAQVAVCNAPPQTASCWATLRQVKTSPPQLLTEADLLSLMEHHEVGTDASMSTHIKNISTRGYVEVIDGRKMRPTHLGIQLITGLRECDPELVNPEVRARIERDVHQVAIGQQTEDQVVGAALNIFRGKFERVRGHLPRMKELICIPPRGGNWGGMPPRGGDWDGKGGKPSRPGPYDRGYDKGGKPGKGDMGGKGYDREYGPGANRRDAGFGKGRDDDRGYGPIRDRRDGGGFGKGAGGGYSDRRDTGGFSKGGRDDDRGYGPGPDRREGGYGKVGRDGDKGYGPGPDRRDGGYGKGGREGDRGYGPGPDRRDGGYSKGGFDDDRGYGPGPDRRDVGGFSKGGGGGGYSDRRDGGNYGKSGRDDDRGYGAGPERRDGGGFSKGAGGGGYSDRRDKGSFSKGGRDDDRGYGPGPERRDGGGFSKGAGGGGYCDRRDTGGFSKGGRDDDRGYGTGPDRRDGGYGKGGRDSDRGYGPGPDGRDRAGFGKGGRDDDRGYGLGPDRRDGGGFSNAAGSGAYNDRQGGAFGKGGSGGLDARGSGARHEGGKGKRDGDWAGGYDDRPPRDRLESQTALGSLHDAGSGHSPERRSGYGPEREVKGAVAKAAAPRSSPYASDANASKVPEGSSLGMRRVPDFAIKPPVSRHFEK